MMFQDETRSLGEAARENRRAELVQLTAGILGTVAASTDPIPPHRLVANAVSLAYAAQIEIDRVMRELPDGRT